jgi:hypothetical protein
MTEGAPHSVRDHDPQTGNEHRIELVRPIFVVMNDEERRRAVAALAALFDWAAAHPECWQEEAAEMA